MDGILEYLENHNYTSMSMYTPYNTNQRLFVFSKVNYYNSIDLNWLYDKYVISYKNQVYNVKIKQVGNYTMQQTLNFGKAIFNKLVYDAIEVHKHKIKIKGGHVLKQYIMKIIKEYFVYENKIHIYRPSLIELNMKINEHKNPGNATCCVCYEFKYIENQFFNCSHNELCYNCFIHCSVCPLCRSI